MKHYEREDKLLRIATTWSIPACTVISLVRWFVAYVSHGDRRGTECLHPVPGGGGYLSFWDKECVTELYMIYQAEFSTIWSHWWILTIILCLLWFMLRYENRKTQRRNEMSAKDQLRNSGLFWERKPQSNPSY